MIDFNKKLFIGDINKLIVHFVGNKNDGDGVKFSENFTDLINVEDYFKQLINKNFISDELHQFYFNPRIQLNPMFQFISSIFERGELFLEASNHIARYLYDKSVHPQIKKGELCIFYIKDCRIDDEILDCVGIFKSENKDVILKIDKTESDLVLESSTGMSTTKLDKGCLIFNTEKENGFLVSVVDKTNKNGEAQYWKDNFLGVQPIENEYHKTNEFLGITKKFVTQELSTNEEVSKADQINILNKSVEYFKNNETFDNGDFEEQVFNNNDVLNSFKKFNKSFQEENNVQIPSEFSISKQAVKKQSRAFKKVLKLDKNFHIYIHGDRDLIEQGTETDGRKFYKIYYDSEQ
ncbi:MAG: nucleoid-associated protein [Crocinitomix sp.]|nr:nucleoid-associated protein [Crocinitomix sp.]